MEYRSATRCPTADSVSFLGSRRRARPLRTNVIGPPVHQSIIDVNAVWPHDFVRLLQDLLRTRAGLVCAPSLRIYELAIVRLLNVDADEIAFTGDDEQCARLGRVYVGHIADIGQVGSRLYVQYAPNRVYVLPVRHK